MARFRFRLSLLHPMARRTAQVLSRPFRMMASPDDGCAGPGWYESSRELDQGLVVHEDFGGETAVAQWREVELQWQRLAQAAAAAGRRRLEEAGEAQRLSRTAAPSSITASA